MNVALALSAEDHVRAPFSRVVARRTGSRRTEAGVSEGTAKTPLEFHASLVKAIAETGDRAAFETLYRYFGPRVKAVALRQGTDPGLAEEIVQETMVNLWRKAALFDPAKAAVSTWVFTIARNVRVDLLRKTLRPEPDMTDPSMTPEGEPPPSEIVSRAEEAGRLHQALSRLPAEQRLVLEQAFLEEKPHTEIATDLDLPLGTVKSRIRLAFRRMRAELGGGE